MILFAKLKLMSRRWLINWRAGWGIKRWMNQLQMLCRMKPLRRLPALHPFMPEHYFSTIPWSKPHFSKKILKYDLNLYFKNSLFFSYFHGLENHWRKADILFIIVDDLNHWVGYTGRNTQCKTPNIDRLAAMGVSFTNATVLLLHVAHQGQPSGPESAHILLVAISMQMIGKTILQKALT